MPRTISAEDAIVSIAQTLMRNMYGDNIMDLRPEDRRALIALHVGRAASLFTTLHPATQAAARNELYRRYDAL